MAKIELPIKNFPSQQRVFDSKARYVIVPKGRRFGITTGGKNDLIKKALKGEYKKALWGDVVNSNIEKYIERLFVPSLKNLPDSQWKWTKDPHVLHIRDSYIDFRSAERPESWEGFGYDYMFLNEAGIILRDEYLWNNAIRPMMWDNPKCKAIIAGTPKGKGTFHELYERGLDKDQPEYESFKFSSFDNPFLSRELIMQDIESMPQRVVQQEIYADFLDDTGVVFRGVSSIAILDPENIPDVNPEHMYVIGADVAKLVDYTVITVYDRSNNRQVYQMRFNALEWPVIRQRLVEISKKFNNALIYLDSTGVGEPLYDDLSRLNIPVEAIHLTNELKKQMIEKLSNFIELRYIEMLKIDETINELNSFTYDISNHGHIIYNAPVGFHDDIVCFTKGTKILTDKGQVSIEKIKVGDMVMTRQGFKPVVNTMSRIKEVITNLGLTGTPEHPIFTKAGIKPLAKVCETDIIYIWNDKLSTIEERTTTGIPNQKDLSLETTSGGMINGKNRLLHFIGSYGLIILVQYLRDILSIIKMVILSIMNSIISNFFLRQNTIDNICYLPITVNGQARMVKNKYQTSWQEGGNGGRKIQKLHTLSHLRMDTDMVEQLQSSVGIKRRVYNLTITDVPEYFANNILVHNCSHSLAIWGLQPLIHRVPVEEMSFIQRDIAIKTGKIDNDDEDFIEVDSWGINGESND
jgi:hypothetical protein